MFTKDNVNYKPIKLRAEDDKDLKIISKWNFNQCFLGIQKAISKCR